jgi:hypothetical protein
MGRFDIAGQALLRLRFDMWLVIGANFAIFRCKAAPGAAARDGAVIWKKAVPFLPHEGQRWNSLFVEQAGGEGFEPPHTDPESAVLPLDEPPTERPTFYHVISS